LIPRPVRALALVIACLAASACAGRHNPSTVVTAGPSATPGAASSGRRPSAVADVPIEVNSRKNGLKYILFTVRKHNRKSYLLRADSESGRYFGQDSGSSSFVNPHVTFYAADGKNIVADAPAGTVVEKDKTVLMSGGVHARTQDGMTLTSDTLRYDDDAQTAHGRGHVVVTSPQGETLQGDTLDWNLRDGTVDVGGAR